MAACWSCGTEFANSASFCSACGAGQEEEPQVIGTESVLGGLPSSAESNTVRVARTPRKVPFLVLAALLPLLGIGAWRLSQNDPIDEAELAQTELDDGVDGSDATDPAELDPDGLPEVAYPDESTTTTTETTTPEPELIVRAEGAVGPVFNRETGLSVIVGSTTGLVEVNLDAGTITELGVRQFQPIMVVDDQLVLARLNGPGLAMAPLSDLTDQQPIETGDDLWARPQGSRTGSFWALRWANASGPIQMVEIEVESGVELRTVDLESGFRSYPPPADPLLYSPLAGGVYRLTNGGGFQLAANGSLIAHGGGIALVESCDAFLNCSNSWLDASTLSPLPLKAPEGRIEGAQVVGGGKWLMFIQGPQWTQNLMNVETGEVVDISQDFNNGGEAFFVSDDGEFVASFNTSNRLVVTDLTTDERVVIREVNGSTSYQQSAVFAPRLDDQADPPDSP